MDEMDHFAGGLFNSAKRIKLFEYQAGKGEHGEAEK